MSSGITDLTNVEKHDSRFSVSKPCNVNNEVGKLCKSLHCKFKCFNLVKLPISPIV